MRKRGEDYKKKIFTQLQKFEKDKGKTVKELEEYVAKALKADKLGKPTPSFLIDDFGIICKMAWFKDGSSITYDEDEHGGPFSPHYYVRVEDKLKFEVRGRGNLMVGQFYLVHKFELIEKEK
jgi:hypothetical protein